VTKEQYLAEVARMLGLACLVGALRRRALWFFLCRWAPGGAAVQLRCEFETDGQLVPI
jgi:hypothetical protein